MEPLAARLERAITRFRVQAAHNLLDEAFGGAAPDVVARELVLPLFERIESMDDPGVIRFATSLFEIRLLVQARGWERIEGPGVTLACAPREERTLALIALGLGLAARGCRIGYLGATTPTKTLADQRDVLTIVSAERDDLSAAELIDLHGLDVALTGRARLELATKLDAAALPADLGVAADRAAALARRGSSRAGDAGSPEQR